MEKERYVRHLMMRGCLVVSLLIIVFLTSGISFAAEKVWKIKIQNFTVTNDMDIQWAATLKFTELVEKHTKGLVKMSLHPTGEMVNPREIWTAVSSGTIDAGCTLDIFEGGTHPEFVFGVASLWTVGEFYKAMNTGVLDILNRQTLPENIRIVGYFPLMNYYAVSMRTKHVKTLEDLKGKKIRGMGGSANLFLKKVGAGIITMPMGEAASALQTGVVDGVHTGMAGIYGMHLWDNAPYFTVGKHGSFTHFIFIREDIYKTLPNEAKVGILAAQKELEGWVGGWLANFWKVVKQDATKKGLLWYELSPKEIDRWRNLMSDCSVEWVMERSPKLGKELFTVVEKATGRKVLK